MTCALEPDPGRLRTALRRIFGPEVAVSVRSVPSPMRALEFEAGRRCASEALQRLGASGASLDIEPDGAPRWPDGFVGSISHSGGWVVAVAASRGHTAGLGVDCQKYRPLPAERLMPMLSPHERAWLESPEESLRGRRAAALFGMKESVQKCVRAAYGFLPPPQAVIVTPDEATGRFSVTWTEDVGAVTRPLPRGAFSDLGSLLLAGATLSASPAGSPSDGIP